MSFWQKAIRFLFYALFILVPLIFLPNTSELFEFNKIILTYIFVVLISACWICDCIIQKRFIFRRTSLDIPLLVFLGFEILSLVFSIDVHTSWFGYYSRWNGGLLSLFSYSILYWAFVTYFDSKSSLNAIRCVLYASVPVALWAVAEHFGVDSKMWVQDVQNRVFSTIGQPNWLAAYIVSLIFIPVSNLLQSFNHSISNTTNHQTIWHLTLIDFLIFILLFSVLLFTKSRSGLLAFGISGMIFGILTLVSPSSVPPLKLRGGKGGVMSVLGLIIAIVIFLTFLIPNPLRDLVIKNKSTPALPLSSSPALETGGTESGLIRKIVWTGAIRIWQGSSKNFWLGTGPETFAMAYYQYRPVEHNLTSEWDLLYNKAHNEFLNQLATTGILGFAGYLILLIIQCSVFIKKSPNTEYRLMKTALLAGWLGILVTNFWGFSVVIVQILMFLLPAIAIALERESVRVEEYKSTNLSGLQKIGLFVSCSSTLILLYSISKYWLADVKLASSQLQTRYFGSTQNPQYLIGAYKDAEQSFQLNSNEPAISSVYSEAAAYLAVALESASATQAGQLAEQAIRVSDLTIELSPHHPNYFKSRSRVAILLSEIDPKYIEMGAESLKMARFLSPTDPKIPYNQGLIAKYQNKIPEAKVFFQEAISLKPDYAEPKLQLTQITSPK